MLGRWRASAGRILTETYDVKVKKRGWINDKSMRVKPSNGHSPFL